MDDDDALLGAGGPKTFEPELFSTDAKAFTVLGADGIGLSENDGKANAVVGGVVVWLVEL